MDDLIKMVAKQAGINEAQAKQAVDTVIAHVKKNLPPQYATLVETLIANPQAAATLLQSLGMMAKK